VKVLLVVHEFLPLHHTGTEQYVRSLALAMRSSGIDAHILAFEPLLDLASPGSQVLERDDELEGIPVRRISVHDSQSLNHRLRDYQNPLASRMVARYIDEVGFDLVHVFHLRNIGAGAIKEVQLRGLPVVVHLMDFWWICPNYLLLQRDGSLCDGPPDGGMGCISCIDPSLQQIVTDSSAASLLRPLAHRPTPAGSPISSPLRQAHALLGRKDQLMTVLGTADCVIAPSLFLGRIYRQHGLPARKLLQLPYGIDPGRFIESVPRKPILGSPHVDIGYIGSISRHKGVHVLLEALRHVPATNLRVHIYGSRTSQPGYSEELIDGIQDSRVTFHGPFSPTSLGSILAGLDALVVPSIWYENTPFSVLEAQYAGLPILASDLGSLPEIVRNGAGGFLFPAGNARRLGLLMMRIAADPATELAQAPPAPQSINENIVALRAIYQDLIANQQRTST